MAELTVFGYRSGTSLLYGLDVRMKLVSIIFISHTGLQAGLFGHMILTIGLVFLIKSIRLSFFSALRELRYFLLLLLFILIARGMSVPGLPVVEWKGILFTRQGLYEGILICWRFIVVVFLGLLFVSTTRTSEMKAAVEWMLAPFPFVPERRVATMIGLTMRFVPVILNQARETVDAQRARGIENRKNPVYRLVKLTVPLIRRTFQDAEKLSLAMEARCYADTRTGPGLSARRRDWMMLIFVSCLCLLLPII